MKKTLSIFICLIIFLTFLGTNIPTIFAATNILETPAQTSENVLNINVNVSSKMYKGVLYIDGVKINDFSSAESGSVSKDIDISSLKAGRHIAAFVANTASGIISDEKVFTTAKSGVATFTGAAYMSGSTEVSESSWTDGKPAPTQDGYKFTLSEDFSGDVKLYYLENEKKILLDTTVTSGNNEVLIKTSRVPFGNTLYIAEFGSDLQYAFKTALSDDVTVYKNLDFEKELGFTYYSDVVNSAKGEVIERADVDGNGVFHASMTSSGDGLFAQTDVGTIANEEAYVVDFKINISQIGTNATLRLLDGTDANGAQRYGFNINSSLKMTQADDDTLFLTKLSYTLSKNTWYRIVVAYNLTSEKYNFYVYDGDSRVYSKENYSIVGALRPTFFKIDVISSGYAVDFMIDDFRVYSGSEKKDDLPSDLKNMGTIMEKASDAEEIIGTASVFTVDSDNYYFANQKRKYPSSQAKPVEIGGVPYVSGEFVSEVLLAQDTVSADQIKVGNSVFSSGSDGVLSKDGKLFLKAEKAASALGKKYTYDDRGYFVFSDSDFTAINSSDIVDIFDNSDIFYRYVMMENPRGEEILSDFKNGSLYGTHPRILMTNEEATWLKSLANAGDSEVQSEIAIIKSRAENHLSWSGITASDSDSVKQTTSSAAQNIITYYAQAYLLTGDSRFAEAGIKILDAASGWSNLAWSTSNLTTGHWAALMAIGYDSFYNYLNATDSGKAKLQTYRNAIENLAFTDTALAYSGNGPRWVTIADNFSGVIGGGMLALCMAVADESQFADFLPYLLENIIKTNELSAALYNNDGAYFEGTTYSEYMLTNLSIGLEALFKACNTDYGIGNARGFRKSGDMFAYLNTPTQTFNFSDSEPQAINSFVPIWFGYRYGEVGAAELNMKRMRADGIDTECLRTIFFYKKMQEKYGVYNTDSMSLDKYFAKTLTGSFRNSFDAKNPVAAFFHLAKNGTTHDHLDAGQWEFEANGIKWVMDLGADDYNLPNYFSTEGYQIYRKHAQGHNLVLINPLKDSTTYFGQKLDGEATLLSYQSTENEASAQFDLTDVYSRDVNSYKRGFHFGDNRTTFTVTDEISLSSSGSEIYWFMHTEADIEISEDKKSAMLRKDGQKLLVEINCSNENYEVLDMAAEPLAGTPAVSGQATETARKLAIHIPSSSTNETISVKLTTFNLEFGIASPADNAEYFEEDVVISVTSPNSVPTVTFDGNAVTLDNSESPTYTATVPFADKALGLHDVVIIADGKEYKRTVEFCSNLYTQGFKYRYDDGNPGYLQMSGAGFNWGEYDKRRVEYGSLEKIAGTDGLTDSSAFRITKTTQNVNPGSYDAYVRIANPDIEREAASGNAPFAVSFDVRRGEDGGMMEFEAKNSSGSTVWLGKPECFIARDGKIDESGVTLPVGEWHNIRIAWECKANGVYYVYYDNKLIHTSDPAKYNYDFTNVNRIDFSVMNGHLDFDNLTYGKYIASPRLDSVAYIANGKELTAVGDVVSVGAEKIVLNLTSSFDTVGSVKVNGVEATAQIDGKKLIVTPASALPVNDVIDIEVGSSAAVSGVSLGKSIIYKVKTSDSEFNITSPVDKTVYYEEDVVISLVSPNDVPTVTFDGATVTLDNSEAPTYAATVPFADKALGLHDVVVIADGKEYKRTVEFCSNLYTQGFKYRYDDGNPGYLQMSGAGFNWGEYDKRRVEYGSLEKIAGTDGLTDSTAFRITKTEQGVNPGSYDAYVRIANPDIPREAASGDAQFAISFDVRRGEDGGMMEFEAKNSSGGSVWLGKPECFIAKDGKIDESGVTLPVGEWHNIRIAWECKANGVYYVYYDNKLIHTSDPSKYNYDFTNVNRIDFSVMNGHLDFDNLTYGKYIINPSLDSVSYTINGSEVQAKDNVISPFASTITLNLTSAFEAGSVSTSNVKINGAAVSNATVDGKKLIITPAASLKDDAAISIEVGGGGTLSKVVCYKVYTGSLDDKLISFTIEEDDNSKVYAVLNYNGGYNADTKNVLILIGAYVGDRLVDGIAAYHPISIGENKIYSEKFTVPSGTTLKAFAWTEDMEPIAMEVK